jgi:hypothetical protein
MKPVPTRARSGTWEHVPPVIGHTRRRGVIRVSLEALESPGVAALTDAEFRCLVCLWAWVARHGRDGEVPANLSGFAYMSQRRLRRPTPRTLARFGQLGLIERYVYEDDCRTETLQIVDWRQVSPLDATSAERKRRYRQRVYGGAYYGTEGEVMEVRPAVAATPRGAS